MLDQSSSTNSAASRSSTGCFRIYRTTCCDNQKNTMKCITHDCPNCSDQGEGRTICVEPDDDGWICEPCWIFLTKSQGRLNQVYKNGKIVAFSLRVLQQEERNRLRASIIYGS